MAFSINDFSNQYVGDYARPNLFEVTIAGIAGAPMFAKAASLPAASVAPIEVPYLNRKLKVPGDRTFADWTVTFINDEAYVVRNALLLWQQTIQGFTSFASTTGVGGAHKKIEVQPFRRDGSQQPGGMVALYGWPSEVGAIELGWETTDAIQEYSVTFAISWDDASVDAQDVNVLSAT